METLTIAAGPSRQLAILVAGMHGFAAAMFALLPLPSWIAVVVLPLLAASAWFTLRRDCLRSLPGALVGLRLQADRRCEFLTRSGDWREAELLGSSFVSPYLTVLNLRPEGGRLARHLVLLPDALEAEDFRRLRVWLKWR